MSEVQWRGKSREDDIRDGPGPDHSAFEASIKAFFKSCFLPRALHLLGKYFTTAAFPDLQPWFK